ncbi:MAG: hypothetical protein KF895_02875 [Parvibaculum sp.]|nr:hypothetical protein [Parvibaculum sp.]
MIVFLAWAKANWKLLAIAALAGVLIGSHIAVYRVGKSVAEGECTAEKLEQATTALETLTGRIENAGKRAADLETGLAGLRTSAAQARKDIQDVLPKNDRACDLPAAARGVLNRSSGYAD